MTPQKISKATKLAKLLTEVELELMNRIWDLGECTIKEVQGSLPADRDLAYTSVATVMKILEQKGFLASRKADRAHTFRPLVTREEYATVTLRHVSENMFQGDPGTMVMRLLDDSRLSAEELERIRNFVDERLGSK